MIRLFLLLFVSIQLFSACSSDSRHKVVGGQLTIYFNEPKAEKSAEKLAVFWKKNKFITGKKQDLKLTLEGKNLTIFMISKNPREAKDISFDEQKMLVDLETRIQSELFPDYNVNLVITDDQFEPVLTL